LRRVCFALPAAASVPRRSETHSSHSRPKVRPVSRCFRPRRPTLATGPFHPQRWHVPYRRLPSPRSPYSGSTTRRSPRFYDTHAVRLDAARLELYSSYLPDSGTWDRLDHRDRSPPGTKGRERRCGCPELRPGPTRWWSRRGRKQLTCCNGAPIGLEPPVRRPEKSHEERAFHH
jgi:hypothetical protein